MRMWKKVIIGILVLILLIALFLFFLAQKTVPKQITYGMSFNTIYANELGLDWREVYDALLDDLQVRHLRLAAHWPMVEANPGEFNFTELDYQVQRAEETDSEVIFAVGRRLPRWPECHVPDWAKDIGWEAQKKEIREYITAVIQRYKNSAAITYWQVENEPYLEVFAKEYCGEFDESFLLEEIELVRSLDPNRPILVTDSGNLGLWTGAYHNGDAFGTSVYVYFWNPELGQFKTALPAWTYRVKENFMRLLYGNKETFLIELSAEPWLIEPLVNVDIETQFTRMDAEKFDHILAYAKDTRFKNQYLWGGEWWYWLKEKGYSKMWERGKELFETE